MCLEKEPGLKTQSAGPGETRASALAKEQSNTVGSNKMCMNDWSKLSSYTQNSALETEMNMREEVEGENSSACPSGWNILIWAHYFPN